MRRTLAAALLAATALAATGCGTMANHSPMWCPDGTRRERVYGGVLFDLETAGDQLRPVVRGEIDGPMDLAGAVWGAGWFLGLDLPLSFVADTFCLPTTLETWWKRRTTGHEPPNLGVARDTPPPDPSAAALPPRGFFPGRV